MAKLGDVFNIIRNGASIKQFDGAAGFPITRIETISDRTIDRNKFGYADIFNIDKYKDYVLLDGDILMSHINSEKHLGKVALYNKENNEQIIHGMNLLMLRPEKNIIIPKYAYYFFCSRKFLKQLPNITKKSVNQASFSVSELRKLDIVLPTKQEQEHIVNVLINVDKLIKNHKQQLQKLDELTKSRFVEMFGDPIVNTMRWEQEKIVDVCEKIYGGGTPSKSHPEYYNGNIPWVSSKDMKSFFIHDSQDHITDLAIANSTAKLVPPFSLIMVIRSGILKHTLPVSINVVPITVNQDLKVFIPNSKLNIYFFAFQMKLMEPDILSAVRAVTADNIEFESLKNKYIIIPPIALQNQFAEFVECIDKSKLAVQQSLDKLETLKKSLMQEYFG